MKKVSTTFLSPLLRPHLPDITLSMLVVSDWLILTALLHMAVTEWWYGLSGRNSVPEWWNVVLLVGLLIVAAVIRMWWSKKSQFLSDRWLVGSFAAASVMFSVVLAGYMQYKSYYQYLQQYPKVRYVSTIVGIPGERAEIVGRNFGHPFEQGSVYLGETELLIVSWNDERVVVEVPVEVTHPTTMVLYTHYGNTSELAL